MSMVSQYEYGNEAMKAGYLSLDNIGEPFDPDMVQISLNAQMQEGVPEPGSPERQAVYTDKLQEIRDNWRIISDGDKTLEVTIANAHALNNDNGVILRISQDTVADKQDITEAIELADDATDNPDTPIIHVVTPGHGGSSSLSGLELAQARKDGSFLGKIYKVEEAQEVLDSYDPNPSFRTMASIIDTIKGSKGKVAHITASGRAAHVAPVVMSLLPDVEGLVLTNPTNISEASEHLSDKLGLAQTDRYIRRHRPKLAAEMANTQVYEEKSTDLLAITTGRKNEAVDVIGEDFFQHAQEERSSASKGKRMRGEERIYMKGFNDGAASIHHIMAGLMKNPSAKATYIFPERSAYYAGRYRITDFMETIYKLYRRIGGPSEPDVKGLLIPAGQFWPRYHPMGRLALQREAFNR